MNKLNCENIFKAIVVIDYKSGEIIYSYGTKPFEKFNNINSFERLNEILIYFSKDKSIPILKHIKIEEKWYWIIRKKISDKLYYLIDELSYIDDTLQKIKKKSSIDDLTECYNKKEILSQVERFLLLFLRNKFPFSILMFDIDFFKKVNDTYGHLAGDFVLKELTKIIKSNLRKSDIMGRFGGEEFLVILPETKIAGAMRLAKRLNEEVKNHKFIYEGVEIKITISIGITTPTRSDSVDSLIDRCDKALYDAKKNGRDRIEYR